MIDVNGLLVEAGLKAGPTSPELVPACQGTSVLFFVAASHRKRTPALLEWLQGQDWAAEVYADGSLGQVGLDTDMALAAAVSMRKSDRVNAHGVPGYGDIMYEPGGLNNVGCGQHGGTGPWEQAPFLILRGGAFPTHTVRDAPTSCTDIAPTVLRHLGEPAAGMDGRALQDD